MHSTLLLFSALKNTHPPFHPFSQAVLFSDHPSSQRPKAHCRKPILEPTPTSPRMPVPPGQSWPCSLCPRKQVRLQSRDVFPAGPRAVPVSHLDGRLARWWGGIQRGELGKIPDGSQQPRTQVFLCPTPNGTIIRSRNGSVMVRRDIGTLTQRTRVWNNWATVPWH